MENEEKLIKEITSKLSLERKTQLLYGDGFWKVRGIPEYNIRPIWLSDGPHGLRKESTNVEDHKGGKSVPATCFPTASALASSWDKDIVYETAKALAFEALDQGVDVVLGPGVNIKRNPLGGRNFEYYSEDPILGGTLAGYFIKGLQDNNVGACLKHFALNNQEKNRMLVNVVADKIAINNIYLKSFKTAYDICEPYMVMCAYNKINGDYASDSKFLLKKTLKEKWNYSGVVVSDWGATNLVSSYKYGLDLDMPRLDDKKKYILRDIKKGLLKIEDIDEAFKRVLRLLFKFQNKNIRKDKLDYDKHHQLSAKIAENCIVLAKNEGILPLKRDDKKIGVIGYFAKESRYQGEGSSLVNSYKVSSFLEVLDEQNIPYEFALGYQKDGATNEELILDAKELAKRKETLLFFVATDDKNQAEGFDRNDLCLSSDIYNLFEELQKINANIITVISCGSAIELKNIISSKGILISYLGGQNVALALKRIIYGEVSPSGHLPETWPISYTDNPMHQYFPGDRVNVFYKESIYVGYRYYDTAKKDVLFPFGHGLTYSTFSYSNLKLKQDNEGNSFLLSFNVKNTGIFKAKEVVQFYLSKVDSKLLRPLQELFDFKKIELKQNEEKTIEFVFSKEKLKTYDISLDKDVIEGGKYIARIGSSSRNIHLDKTFEVSSEDTIVSLKDKLPSYYDIEHTVQISDEQFSLLYQSKLPSFYNTEKRPFTYQSSFYDIRKTFIGKQIFKIAKKYPEYASFVREAPLRAITMSGIFNQDGVNAIVDLANGKMIRGSFKLLTKGINKKEK